MKLLLLCSTKYNASQRGLNFKISLSLSVFNEIVQSFNVQELPLIFMAVCLVRLKKTSDSELVPRDSKKNIRINPNSLDNKGSCWILKDFYCSVTMLRELGLKEWYRGSDSQFGIR